MKTQPDAKQVDEKNTKQDGMTSDYGTAKDDLHGDFDSENETPEAEFYKAGYSGVIYKIGDWIGLRKGQRYHYGIIRYFLKTASSDMYVYVTELTLVGTGPPYSYKSFTYGDETFFSVNCIREHLKMLKARYL